MEAGFLREWKVKPGDYVQRGDIIAEVETQKGIIDIEVFDEGIIGELVIKEDDKVPVGTLMTYIHTSEKEVEKEPELVREESKMTAVQVKEPVKQMREPVTAPVHRIRASPLAKRIAAEKGIDISKVRGSGPEGAVIREDIEKAVQEKVTQPHKEIPPPIAEEIAPPSVSVQSYTENIRMAVAAAMSRSNREIPHYYLQTKVDMTAALTWLTEANRQRSSKDRLLPAVLLLKAVAKALTDVPDLNGWWENGLQRKKDIHIGFVVSLRTGGVIVPAIHHVDEKSPDELMKMLSDIIPRARALKLRSSELADSTITVTSLGEGAVETVYGVIYPPQVALVGFGGITEEPWAENGMVGVRPVMTVTLAADHRATDGNIGNQFLTALKQHLKQPEQL
ncbi:Dihydrolipoamide acetyltransferase component of pyruvate dehydrogenase complex [Fulvivirga imtechensis AK7]|uniref:Dihydrolipoamide acetyltransferase component of pyruvate dehydrogenase complex n=2 Tax=Fulvivirga TaxID=396811 RepID=L8JSB5_9BACT|nr:Dihydrolipoamide acetyltransferase component of pyruvate dehydrogenase complex [Fulvivirga imtechensis AK7]